MNSTRSFLVHLGAFFVLQAAILVGVWMACPRDPGHYMAATVDKHARLRAAPRPRLIFVGGSSVGFSVDSREFDELGLAPVNMGLNDGLGLRFMLAEVAGELGAGDVVVVMPETHLYWTGSEHDAIWAAVEQRPASLACVAPADARAMADQGLHFLARKLRCAAHQVGTEDPLPTIYRRSSFDERGDFVAHRDRPRKQEAQIAGPWPPPKTLDLDASIAALQDFAERCDEAGARCFLAWSPIRADRLADPIQAAVLERVATRLRAEVALPQLEAPAEAAFPEVEFFDRGPHLRGGAAARRSRRLAARLAARLDG